MKPPSSSATLLSTQLDLLSKKPLDQADDVALVSFALGFWYSDESLESALTLFLNTHRSDVEVQRTGYLLERMTQFTSAKDSRVSEAHSALRLITFHKRDNAVPKGRFDRVALSWGLKEGLGLKVQVLLPYQTRHFSATMIKMQLD